MQSVICGFSSSFNKQIICEPNNVYQCPVAFKCSLLSSVVERWYRNKKMLTKGREFNPLRRQYTIYTQFLIWLMTRTFNSFINVQNPGYNIQYRRLKNNLLISSKRKNDIINLELRTFLHAKRALYHCVTTPYFKGFRKKNGRRKGKRSEKCSPNFYMLILSYFCFVHMQPQHSG